MVSSKSFAPFHFIVCVNTIPGQTHFWIIIENEESNKL